MGKTITILDAEYKTWISELSSRYRKSQIKAALKVNDEMLRFYYGLGKDSSESYFIQICDFVSHFVHLYFKCVVNGQPLPARVQNVIDTQFVSRVMATLKYYDRLNLKASKSNEYGLVIYPK